ncbi:hypothetical protein M0R45_014728 [Rubus argutus]|uniref:Uncharacterized protein n=1 Tax=Rubus argutus TaxID=59490 RepID=A0AAW1XPZ2_RUBAR
MMRKTSSSCLLLPSSDCSSRRGMPCLPSTLIVMSNNYSAFFILNPQTQTIHHTQLGKLVRDGGPPPLKPRVTNLEDALKVFDEMLQRRPLPSAVLFQSDLDSSFQIEALFSSHLFE